MPTMAWITWKLKILAAVVSGWLVFTSLYAYYYVVSILSLGEEYDAYARNWQFQLLMFTLVRLPFLVAILLILIGGVFALPPRRNHF